MPEKTSVDNPRDWHAIKITARDLSTEGLGFLYHQQLSSDQIIVCLTDDTLVLGTIPRQRLVHEGYRDCGVRFSRKLDLQKDAELLPHANVEAIN